MTLNPPRAEQRPHSYEHHGIKIEDPYHWIRDPGYPEVSDEEVLNYLKAENAYFETVMAPHQPLIEELFQEMKGRMKEDDRSVPAKNGDWLYWWAFEKGAQYRKWYRKPVLSEAEGPVLSEAGGGGGEQLIFDEAAEAEGKQYFRLASLIVSDDGRLAATMADDEGSERFKLRIRDLDTGADIETVTEVGIGTPVWAADSRTIIFNEVNENWRSYRARLHRIGEPAGSDITLYEETEELGFSVGVSRSQDRSLIFISTGDNSSTEVRFLSAADPAAGLTLISPRQPNRIYSADAAHGKLWILANDEHVNFRVAEADPQAPGEWRTVIAGSDEAYLRSISAFRDHLVIEERLNGLDQIRLRSYRGEERRVRFPEASYSASLGTNPEFAQAAYRMR